MRRFAPFSSTTLAGPHWHIPYPIEKVEVVNTDQIRNVEIGFRTAATGQQQVQVEGRQFAWIVTPSTITAGVPVRFEVTATDVNHGFAVYNDDNSLLFQIQALPGSTSTGGVGAPTP